MSDPRDPVSARYRELARDEPPAHLDAAILAASRRAVGARPGAQRWLVPASIAAVLVLGIGVALRMQVEQPGIETSAPQSEYTMPATPAAEAPVAEPTTPQAARERAAPPAAPPTQPRQARPMDAAREPAPLQRKQPPEPSPVARDAAPAAAAQRAAASPLPHADARAAASPLPHADAAAAAAMAPPAAIAAPPVTMQAAPAAAPSPRPRLAAPEAELERIARLREAGRDDEADKALAEFHRRFPGHRITDAMRERVKPR